MESSKRPALKVGDKISMTTVLAGAKTPCVYELMELDPPHKCVFYSVSRFHESKDTVTFEEGPGPGEVTIDYVTEIDLIRWFKYFNLFANPVMKWVAKEAVDGMEEKLRALEPKLRETVRA
jgi:hypothetical protein